MREESQKRKFCCAVVLVGALMLIVGPAPAHASTLTFNYSFVFSGNTPVGPTPYITAVFDDGGGTGSVTLTLTSHLTSGQFVTEWDFNSSLFPGNFAISAMTVDSGTVGTPTVESLSADAYQADGDGKYDFGFVFQSAAAQRFDDSDIVHFTITGTGITANTFAVFAAPGGGAGPFESAAHIQGIPNNSGGATCSGWVSDQSGATSGLAGACGGTTVPEPSSLVLLGSSLVGIGAAGMGFLRRRNIR